MSFDVVLVVSVVSLIAVGTFLALLGKGSADPRLSVVARPVLLVAAACVTGYLGWSSFADLRALDRRGIVTTAEVEDVTHGKYAKAYVSFSTERGQRVRGTTSNFLDEYVHDGRMDVVYDPEEPTRFQAADYGFDPVEPVIEWVLAAGLLLGAALTLPAVFGRPVRKGRSRR